ncbi:MAG: hypothetical protein A2474_03640 [Elusimicrobia bacterium RIFOXYC2_FULL_34_12]|nr:MAG: hypothetical protein A2474_03640 [Elusimicrobia bacterium RIFOXYC2_FULL_34_12]HAM38774.1 hypothetical protein [Elusimicrobiota bacterium]
MKKYVIIFSLIFIIAVFLTVVNTLTYNIILGKRINGILIGTDSVETAVHSDTIIFFSYNPKQRFLDIISIPRDTKISIDGIAIRKINQLYAYTHKKTKNHNAAADSVRNELQDILGLDIPYYAQVDYDGFRSLINILGGIKMRIDQRMDYDDNWGNLHIHFSTGIHHLNGQKALEYVRYRTGDRADLDRVLRQQSFMREVVNKLKEPKVVLGFPKIVKTFYNNIHTNISVWDMLSIIYEFKNFNISNIRLQSIAGKPSRGLWIPDFHAIQRTVELVLNGHVTNLERFSSYSNIVVEIFNASGKSGLAGKIRRKLIKNHFDVIKIGTYDNNSKYEKTLVIDRMGQLDKAREIANEIGAKEVITKIDESRGVDVTIILGRDWQGLNEVK